MKPENFYELFELISAGISEIPARKQTMQLRKAGLEAHVSGQGFNKVAFDTRRIDQETEYNPRRGLQNYNRSEAFLSEAMGEKIKNFAKLRNVLQDMKEQYGKEHEWQDSNARVLLSTLDVGLRTMQKDGDYAVNQPAQGSFNYIEELLHMRYRLTFDDLSKKTASELRKVILSKDEELTRKDVNKSLEITKSDVGSQTYDTLMEKLFGNVRASVDGEAVERTVTITIRDSIIKKES
jgi:hypothetical protein